MNHISAKSMPDSTHQVKGHNQSMAPDRSHGSRGQLQQRGQNQGHASNPKPNQSRGHTSLPYHATPNFQSNTRCSFCAKAHNSNSCHTYNSLQL